jgi:hypothetical protein
MCRRSYVQKVGRVLFSFRRITGGEPFFYPPFSRIS